MGAPDILQALEARGVRLNVVGDNLVVTPKRLITDADRQELRSVKPDLIAYLIRRQQHLEILMQQAGARLRADATLRRAIEAEPDGSDMYVVAVAVRLDDGAIVTCLLHSVCASWDQIMQALHAADERDREAFEERAAIREFDGDQTRAEAEAGALLEIIRSKRQ